MMYITVHGLKFYIDSHGFVKSDAESDLDRGIEAIRGFIDSLPADEVAMAHAACLAWVADDCSGPRPYLFDRAEAAGDAVVTAGWHNPSAAWFNVSAGA